MSCVYILIIMYPLLFNIYIMFNKYAYGKTNKFEKIYIINIGLLVIFHSINKLCSLDQSYWYIM